MTTNGETGDSATTGREAADIATTNEVGLSPMDYAVSLGGAQPELISPVPAVQGTVFSYINGQTNTVYNLATVISKQGPATATSGWATQIQVGKFGDTPVYQLVPSSDTMAAAGPLIQGTLTLVKQDTNLQNKLWTVQQGISGPYRPVSPPVSPYEWTADNWQPRYGINAASISGSADTPAFQIVLGNVAPAFYCLYAEFLDASGTALTPAGWASRLPKAASGFETGTMKFLSIIQPTDLIAGIDMSVDEVTASCTPPAGTASVRLTFATTGSVGWDPVVNSLPLMLSAVLGWTVPWIMQSAGYNDADWYNTLLTDTGIAAEIVSAAGFLSAADTAADALGLLAGKLGSLLFGGSLPKTLAVLRKSIGDTALAQAANSIGWPLAGQLYTLQAGVSTGLSETLSVPAAFTQTISLALIIDSTVDISPDPAHGAWPLTAASYEIDWQAEGDCQKASGSIDGMAAASPIAASFSYVARDAEAAANVYLRDAAGNVVAKGQAQGSAASPQTVTVTELPPSPGASYAPVASLAYDGQAGYVWRQPADADSSTAANLDCSNSGTLLCQLTGISYNEGANAVVYGWRASGPGVPVCGGGSTAQQLYRLQSVSVSASPDAALKPASCGFYTMTTIAAGETRGDNLFFDTRTSPYALRDIALGDPSPFQFPTGQSRGYLTLAVVDDLVVHPAGYAAAVSAAANVLQIVQLSAEAVSDSSAPGPYSVGGAGTRAGLLQQPVAVAVAPDGSFIVLESGNKRLQAFDVFGNNIDYFGGSPLLALRQDSGLRYLDMDIDSDGNFYVLSCQNGGTSSSQYTLDVYSAGGTLLASTSGFNAAKIAVDAWRNIYALDYSLITGPGGSASPAVRIWSPAAG